MKVLALDIAKTTGWAFSSENGTVISGSAKFTEMDFGDLAFSYHRWIVEMLEELRPELVAYEAPVVKHPHATKILIGLSWIVVLACRERHRVRPSQQHRRQEIFRGGNLREGRKAIPRNCGSRTERAQAKNHRRSRCNCNPLLCPRTPQK